MNTRRQRKLLVKMAKSHRMEFMKFNLHDFIVVRIFLFFNLIYQKKRIKILNNKNNDG